MDKLTMMLTFKSVVETGSFTAAGKQLYKSKALLSKQVKDLEEHLGCRLLNRSTRRLYVTEFGKIYYKHCLYILNEIADFEESIKSDQSSVKGVLRLSAPQTFSEMYLTDALIAFLKKFPLVKLEVTLNDCLVNIIEDGYDVAIRIGNLSDSNLVARHLAPIRLILCGSEDYLKSHDCPVLPRDLVNHSCVIDSNIETGTSWVFKVRGTNLNIPIKGNFRVNSAISVKKAVESGLGIGMCPSFTVQESIKAGKIIPLLEEYETDPVGLYAIYPHRRHLATKIKVLISFLSEYFKENKLLF